MRIQLLLEDSTKQRRLNEKEWVERKHKRHLENGFKWLDYDVTNQYYKKFMETRGDATSQKRLSNELMKIYGVTENEAVNILQGKNVGDYIHKYERIRTRTPVNVKKKIEEKDEM